jgi:hypothetical protein
MKTKTKPDPRKAPMKTSMKAPLKETSPSVTHYKTPPLGWRERKGCKRERREARNNGLRIANENCFANVLLLLFGCFENENCFQLHLLYDVSIY